MVFTIDNTCIGNSITSDILAGKYQRTIIHRYTSTRTLQQEIPRRIFYLFRNIYRFRPGFTIIVTLHQHKLCCVVHIHSRLRIPPSTSVTHSVCPCCYNPDSTGFPIHQDSRVSHTILSFWQTFMFAERHRDTHLFPSLSAVCTSAQPYFYIFLQVCAVVVANIIYTKQRTFIRSCQSRNTISCYPVIAGMTNTNSHIVGISFAHNLHRSSPIIHRYSCHFHRYLCKYRSCWFHLQTNPKIVHTRIQFLVYF